MECLTDKFDKNLYVLNKLGNHNIEIQKISNPAYLPATVITYVIIYSR